MSNSDTHLDDSRASDAEGNDAEGYCYCRRCEMSRDMLQTPILLAVSFLTQLTANHKLICMKINKNVSRYPKIPLNKNWTGITCGTTLYRSLRCLFTSFVIFHDALKCSSDKRATGGNKIRETPIFVVSPRQPSFSHRITF